MNCSFYLCDKCGKIIGSSFDQVSIKFSNHDMDVDLLLCAECAREMYRVKDEFVQSKRQMKSMSDREKLEYMLNQK